MAIYSMSLSRCIRTQSTQQVRAYVFPRRHAQCASCGKLIHSDALNAGRISQRSARFRVAAGASDVPELDLSALIDVPNIADDLKSFQETLGATFDADDVAVSFGEENDRKAAEAWQYGIVLVDRSHWGRIRVAGEDRLSFLHAQSTSDLAFLPSGCGKPTVFVTATGRTIDTGIALSLQSGAMLIVSPDMAESLMARLNKYIFPTDLVSLSNVSSVTNMFTLAGPEAHTVVAGWGSTALLELPENGHAVMAFNETPVLVVKTSGLGPAVSGWTFILDESVAADFWRKTALKGALPMGQEIWESVRILNGVPAPGTELIDIANPLEAGLYDAVSLSKGCYIGQETLAKVYNNNGVKQQLWGLRLRAGESCEVGAPVTSEEGRTLGSVTSVTQDDDHSFALAYLRCRLKGEQQALEGLQVNIGGIPAKVTAIPYATRQFSDDALPQQVELETPEPVGSPDKAAKKQAMEDRVAAWKAQQG